MAKKWICSQIGAREHYAIPRALHQTGRLSALYTDYWAGKMVRFVSPKTNVGTLHSLAARFHPDLADAPVHSWNLQSPGWLLREKHQARTGSPYLGFIHTGQCFATKVLKAMEERDHAARCDVFFSYDTGAMETLDWCRKQGIKCVLNQMDPNRVEMDLVREEEKRWPGWQLTTANTPEEYFERRQREWALADRVVVNSDFCRRALIRQGVAPEKLFVMPLCYERSGKNQPPKTRGSGPGQSLRVLFLGQVILRKGIQYLMEAARKLEGEKIHFDIVGPVGISAKAVASAPGNLSFHGRATRDQVASWYGQADLFVLPTLSDGFAITQLEAMAHGLPVITTPCCGEVVTDGVDGFIVPPSEAGELARTFQRYLAQPDLAPSQSAGALEKAGQFTLNRLAENLTRLEAELQ